MRPVASLFMCLFAGIASAAEPQQRARQALVVAIPEPGNGVAPLERAREDAADVSERLTSVAGFDHVVSLIDGQVTAADLAESMRSAVASTRDDGVLLVLIVAHGAGGDFGAPAVLTHGASVADPGGTGLSIDALASALRPRTPDQSIVVVMDVAHKDVVGDVALIGPAASDWPGMPEWGLAVTSKAAGEAGASGVLFPAINDGLGGSADADYDGQVTISELARFLDDKLGAQEGTPLDRAGAVAANLMMSVSGREKSAVELAPAALPPIDETRPFKLKPAAIGLASVGAIAGIVSVGMYVSKRDECEDQGGRLVCGDDDAYRRYRAAQVALGVAGAGMVVAGVGMQLIPTTQGAVVGLSGRF